MSAVAGPTHMQTAASRSDHPTATATTPPGLIQLPQLCMLPRRLRPSRAAKFCCRAGAGQYAALDVL